MRARHAVDPVKHAYRLNKMKKEKGGGLLFSTGGDPGGHAVGGWLKARREAESA